MEVSGTIVRLFFGSPTFCAGKIRRNDSHQEIPFSLKGYVANGENVTLQGDWAEHPKYGKQFQATSAYGNIDVSEKGIALWLEHNAPGIGQVRSTRIAAKLGISFPDVLKNDTARFAEVADISLDMAEECKRIWCESEAINSVQTQLGSWGLTRHQIQSLTRQFGPQAAKLLSDDPYQLLWIIDGFGWRRVDEIAIKIGIVRDDPKRRKAAVVAAIHQRYNQDGWTCCADPDLANDVAELLSDDTTITSTAFEAGLRSNLDSGRIVEFDCVGVRQFAMSKPFDREMKVLDFLKTGSLPNPLVAAKDADKTADCFSTMTVGNKELVLSPDQKAGLNLIAKNRITVISGGAGSGKTTMVRAAYEMFMQATGRSVALCAPTGKAARRLSEATGGDAMTIHRLLGYNPEKGGFEFDEDNPLPYRAVICDELSMVGVDLGWSLFQAIPCESCVVLVGDHNQLPPISAGAILRDVLARKIVPGKILEHCHRQAGILKENCTAILSGELRKGINPTSADEPSPWYVHDTLDTAEKVMKVVEKLFTQHVPRWGIDPLTDVQFMSPIHAGPIGTKAINRFLQRLHQKSLGRSIESGDDERPKLHEGDKAIHVKNNYELQVMNGTVGIVVDTMPLTVQYGQQTVVYDDTNKGQVELAYCLTPHKMQGSEVPIAITIVHSMHKFMLHRNWLYTACTRAKRTSAIIGDEAGCRTAVTKIVSDCRSTVMGSISLDAAPSTR